jgi:uncharacterized UPF0160 family protein
MTTFNLFNFTSAVESVTVHSGIFHADDVAVAALLRLQFPDVLIIRNNNPDVKAADVQHIIADVGRQHDGVALFDHHQLRPIKDEEVFQSDGCILLKKGTPKEEVRAAVGLLWDAYGKKDEFPTLSGLIHSIDLHDTGVVWTPAWTTVRDFYPTWDSDENPDEAFLKAVEWLTPALVNAIQKDLAAAKAADWLAENATVLNDAILVMDKFVPWQSYAKEHGLKMVVFPGRDPGSYNLQVADPAWKLPKEWLDSKPTGVTFVTNWLSMAACSSKEDALRLATECVNAALAATAAK